MKNLNTVFKIPEHYGDVDAKNLARNLDEVASERKGLRDMLLKFNQIGQSFQNLTNHFSPNFERYPQPAPTTLQN